MIRELNTAPVGFPITLAQIKTFAFMNTDNYDDAISALIPGGVSFLENYLGKVFVNQVWDLYYDLPEFANVMPLGLNVNSISAVVTFDRDNNETTIASTEYRLFNNQLIFNEDQSLSSVSSIRLQQSIKVTVSAGFGADSTDQDADIQASLSQYIAYQAKDGGKASTDGREAEVLFGVKQRVAKHFNRTVWL